MIYIFSVIKLAHWTIYSVVLEKWFCKLGFFFWSTTFLEPEKNVDL